MKKFKIPNETAKKTWLPMLYSCTEKINPQMYVPASQEEDNRLYSLLILKSDNSFVLLRKGKKNLTVRIIEKGDKAKICKITKGDSQSPKEEAKLLYKAYNIKIGTVVYFTEILSKTNLLHGLLLFTIGVSISSTISKPIFFSQDELKWME